MSEDKKIFPNLVLNKETIYEFNNSTLESPVSSNYASNNTSNITEDASISQNNSSSFDLPTNHVVSEKVQNLAAQIYTELQRIIVNNNDDDDIVADLMPLIVNVLESLDLQLIETQQLQVELELMKDDNDQLVNAFEKEKQVKKKLEQQLFEYEFNSDEEKQKLNQKIISLENIVKMIEIKFKNSNDTVSRLEEEKNELKSEFNNLHHRNNELLRSYLDLMERVKILVGSDDVSNLTNFSIHDLKKNASNVLNDNLNNSCTEINNTETIKSNTNDYNLNEFMSMEDNQSLNDVSLSLADEIKNDNQSLVGPFVNPSEYASTDNYGFNGMEKEVENLIRENNELLATKNALNIVKDDLITQVDDLQSRLALSQQENNQLVKIEEVLKQKTEKLEEELKKTISQKEELTAKLNLMNEDSEEGVPNYQRKKFTRSEMAKILIEKNKYKEKLLEMEETIRWTDRVRQSSNRLEVQEKRSSIWKIFSNFFTNTSNVVLSSSPSDVANVKYQSSNSMINLETELNNKLKTSSNIPALDSMRRRIKQQQKNNSNELMVFLDNDLYCEMKKMNKKGSQLNSNNIVAYGWCLQQQKNDGENIISQPVPVPIHCRPLATSSQNNTNGNSSTGLRIWCAAAVDLNGGEAGFPRSISNSNLSLDDNSKNNCYEATPDLSLEQRQLSIENKLSTFTWICSVSHSRSKVTIVNMKSSPSEILDSFYVNTHLFCVCSVPGTKNSDTLLNIPKDRIDDVVLSKKVFIKKQNTENNSDKNLTENSNNVADKLSNYLDYYQKTPNQEFENSNIKQETKDKEEKFMSTVLPTMWLGGQNSRVYVHSSVAQWSQLIDYVDLSDSILNICHYKGKVLVSLANGELCIFSRNQETGEWNLKDYYVLNLGNCLTSDSSYSFLIINSEKKSQKKFFPIRCSTVAGKNIWCGYRNLVIVFEIDTLKLLNIHAAHSTNEEKVKQLATISYDSINNENNIFVLCILRLDCVLRIYQNSAPFDCIYNVDLEPTINKFLICNLSSQRSQLDKQQSNQELNNKVVGVINFIRLTALKVTENRIWLGTENGVILTISHIYDFEKNRPKLILQDCQLSFHGHKDAVKFFVAAKNLVLSGGEGYTDFRLEPESDYGLTSLISRTDQSHLILWEVNMS